MLTALLLLAAAPGETSDPLAEARAGKIQCVTPNRAARTCMGLGSFTVQKDGSFDSVFQMLIAPTPLISIEIRAGGRVEEGAVCNVVHKADYADARVLMDGAPANPLMAQAILDQMTAALEPLDGKKACAREKPEGDVILAEATVDGAPRPDLTQRYIWVKPDEGYRLGQ